MYYKKFIVACVALFFLTIFSFGLEKYPKDPKQEISQSKLQGSLPTKTEKQEFDVSDKVTVEIIEETVEEKTVEEKTVEEKTVEQAELRRLKNSEQAVQSEKSEFIEQKRPSLTTASRGGSLAPTLPSKPATATSISINGWSQADYYWLAKMIHAESRGEPYEGQIAVGAVILRRVQHPDFPNTVYGVIFDKWDGKYYQFSPVADGSINLEPNETAYNAARDAMNGSDPSGGALYFYNPAKSTSQWILTRPILRTIGEHTFAL